MESERRKEGERIRVFDAKEGKELQKISLNVEGKMRPTSSSGLKYLFTNDAAVISQWATNKQFVAEIISFW